MQPRQNSQQWAACMATSQRDALSGLIMFGKAIYTGEEQERVQNEGLLLCKGQCCIPERT